MRLHDEFCTVSFDFIDVFSDEFTAVPGYRVDRRGGTSDWLLFYTLGGSGTFLHKAGAEVVSAHDTVLVTPGTPQRYAIAPGAKTWRFCWAHFHAREHWLGWLNWPASGRGILRIKLDDLAQRRRLLRYLRELNELTKRPDRSSRNFAMNQLEAVLLVLDEANRKSAAPGDPRVNEALGFILRNLATPLSLQRIADALAISESRLWHLFAKQVGHTPQDYIELQRMARAKLMLERTDQSVEQVAHAVGFPDASYFTRRFRLHAGFSPIGYRRHIQAHPADIVMKS